LAEKEAWKIAANQKQWQLVTINPGFVMGPSLSNRVDSTSIDTMRSLLNGKYKSGVPELFFGIVDVRDVARAHILAATKDDASGRHICVGHQASIFDMAKLLRKKYPDFPIPKNAVPKLMFYLLGPVMGFSWKYVSRNIGVKYSFDNSKSLQLGVTYRSLEETLTDHADQLMADKLV
jgi:nucleoside-diphosphate-sugar epimerase